MSYAPFGAFASGAFLNSRFMNIISSFWLDNLQINISSSFALYTEHPPACAFIHTAIFFFAALVFLVAVSNFNLESWPSNSITH